jgi:hypothetical protein
MTGWSHTTDKWITVLSACLPDPCMLPFRLYQMVPADGWQRYGSVGFIIQAGLVWKLRWCDLQYSVNKRLTV